MNEDYCIYCSDELEGRCGDNTGLVSTRHYFGYGGVGNTHIGWSEVGIHNGNKLEIWSCINDKESTKSVKINYCPMCGRKLKGEPSEKQPPKLLEYINEYRHQCEDDCKGIERCERCNQMLFDEIEEIVRRELDD